MCSGRRSRTSHIRPSQTQTDLGLTPRYAAAGILPCHASKAQWSLRESLHNKARMRLGSGASSLMRDQLGVSLVHLATRQPVLSQSLPCAPLAKAKPSTCDIRTRGLGVNFRQKTTAALLPGEIQGGVVRRTYRDP